jgi:VWFA-related protein
LSLSYWRTPAVYFLILNLLYSQTPPAAPQQPVVRVTTRLMQINVVVHRKNEPLADLKKEDFEIYDQGVKQTVATFAMESSEVAPAVVQARAKLVLPPNTFTNRAELRPKTPNAITVLLLDGLNTKFEDQVYAKRQLIAFLKQLKPDDRVAIYELGNKLRILHDFSSDNESLIRVANGQKTRINTEVAASEPEAPNTGDDQLDQWMAAGDQKIADFQVINRVQSTLSGLEAIANHLARIPGRKNLVWISSGFPFSIGLDIMSQPEDSSVMDTRERRDFSPELERAARAVNAANLAIYPVDARGLVGMTDFGASSRGNANPRLPPPGPANSKAMEALYQTQSTMNIIANRTGGKAYMNSNDLKGAIRAAIDDSKITYTIGFYPTNNTWDNKWHELKVKVNRPGVNVRYRNGYFAFADQPVTVQSRRAEIQKVVATSVDSTSLGLTVRAGLNVPKPGSLRVIMLLDARNIQLEQKEDKWTGMLDVMFLLQSAPGKSVSVVADTLPLSMTKAVYLDILKRGLPVVRDFPLADAAYALRIAVRDATSGASGSMTIRTDQLKPEPPPAPKPAEEKK